ncbi:MAG: lactate utilization protein [Lentimicrobium sp.]|nr:lactate utilization protein [Lentimicrobium sp.]
MTENHIWHYKAIGQKVVSKLIKHGFEAKYFESKNEAIIEICAQFHPGMKVAFGGSITARKLGLREAALKSGAVLIDHGKPGLGEDERLEIMRQELHSDLFISSANAITLDGSIVNADGYGNRVASMIFGPRKVIVIAGINKITSNEETALERIKNTAAPMNMKRLNRDTPCTEDGICHDCNQPERGCRAYTIIRRRPSFTPTMVIIIGENLGL